MKKYIAFIAFLTIVINCEAQRKIKKSEVEEEGFNVNLNFSPVSDEMNHNNLKLKITPISTSSLNEKFLQESSYNGIFEYSHYEKSRNSYFLKKRKRKREKSDYEFLLEGVEWLFDNDKIILEEYDEILKQLVLNYDYEKGEEIYNTQKIISSNPYYVDGKYFNVFELNINNSSNSFQKIDSELLVESGNLLLHPLSTEEIIYRLEKGNLLNHNKIQTLNRYNLPERITIPPNSTIIKYFAIEPINYNNSELKISLYGVDTKFKWMVNKNHDSFNEKYKFFEFSTDWNYDDFSSDLGENFYLLKSSDNIYFTNEAFFIGENFLNEEFELITLSLYSDKLFFSKSKYKGNEFIDFDKNRRKSIPIQTHKIDDLKKKVRQ